MGPVALSFEVKLVKLGPYMVVNVFNRHRLSILGCSRDDTDWHSFNRSIVLVELE